MLFEGNERREREKQMKADGRLPPGQSLTLKWPVLHYGSVPRFDPATWDFRITGLVANPMRLTWDEFNRLPKVEVVSDFHCVTRWSRFDNRWCGVSVSELLNRAKLRAGSWISLAADRASSLRMEIGQVGERFRTTRSRSGRLLGTERLPHVW